MPKYNIQVVYPDPPQRRLIEVHGYPLTIPELEGVELFIHRPIGACVLPEWNISEKKTGIALIENSIGTKQQAIEALQSKLRAFKIPDLSIWVKGMIGNFIAENGIANKE